MDTAHARLDGKVAFLASEESGMMTGVNVDYDQTTAGCWEQAPHPTFPA